MVKFLGRDELRPPVPRLLNVIAQDLGGRCRADEIGSVEVSSECTLELDCAEALCRGIELLDSLLREIPAIDVEIARCADEWVSLERTSTPSQHCPFVALAGCEREISTEIVDQHRHNVMHTVT